MFLNTGKLIPFGINTSSLSILCLASIKYCSVVVVCTSSIFDPLTTGGSTGGGGDGGMYILSVN